MNKPIFLLLAAVILSQTSCSRMVWMPADAARIKAADNYGCPPGKAIVLCEVGDSALEYIYGVNACGHIRFLKVDGHQSYGTVGTSYTAYEVSATEQALHIKRCEKKIGRPLFPQQGAPTGDRVPLLGRPKREDPSRRTASVGVFVGPSVYVHPGSLAMITFGPEISSRFFQLPLLLGFGDGMKILQVTPKFKYDIDVARNLLITPSLGPNFGFLFYSDNKSFIFGLEFSSRVTYLLTPRVGIFVDPLSMDFNIAFKGNNDGLGGGFTILYRAQCGVLFTF